MSKICATIAAKDNLTLSKMIDKALKKTDMIEIRFDYIKRDDLNEALQIASKVKDKAIFTCRVSEEGGKFEGSEEERLEIIRHMLDIKPLLVDIEYDTLINHKELCANNILVSWHNFKHTPNHKELHKQMNKMLKLSNNVKIVTFANEILDNKSVLQLYNYINDNIKLVTFCMGEFGIVSRVLSMLYGAPFTYVTIDKPVAAGQLIISDLKDILKKITIDDVILNRVINIIDETIL